MNDNKRLARTQSGSALFVNILGVTFIALTILAIVFYFKILPGISSARSEPPVLEVTVAQWMLNHSVPEESKQMQNPIGDDKADISAGQALYQSNCETCHAFDGSGKTRIGIVLFPRAPNLKESIIGKTDGEVFYHIRNGIRNTGMPAWDLPERQVWQIVSFIRQLPTSNPPAAADALEVATNATLNSEYVGSAACQSCHEDTYARWKETKMANVVRDPKLFPNAVLPDFSVPDPLLTFSLDDVALVYGSGWKQRYFQKIGEDYFPFPAQWDVINKTWRRYHVGESTDWWVPHYPDSGDNLNRPTGPLCDGCHSVSYNIETKTPVEWNVGCESCHGAGSEHVENPVLSNILNPAHMSATQANDTCMQCHSQGQPIEKPIAGVYYDWPVGFKVGLDLADFWEMEEHKIGEQTFTHFADGTAHKNRMQGNDYIQSAMYQRGVTCGSCHDSHGTENTALLREPVEKLCLTCHAPKSQNGPRENTLQAHTHHAEGSAGSECVACHMPKIAQTISNINVRSHTFKFVTPAQSEAIDIPNACNLCHTEETTDWATSALESWGNFSPWRMSR